MKLHELRRIAESATPKKWQYRTAYGVAFIENQDGHDIASAVEYLIPDNATFMTTFDPIMAKKLLDVVEACQKAYDSSGYDSENYHHTIEHHDFNGIHEALKALEDK